MAVDLRPFEAAFPDEVREAIELARAAHGPAVDWVLAKYPRHQIDAAVALLRTGPPELAGWCAGITMFGDSSRVIAGIIDREGLYAAIPHVLDAFAAGINARVKPTKHQWGSIERLANRNSTASPGFLAMLPAAVCQVAPIARAHACRIAAMLGDPAREVLLAAQATAAPREREKLDAALETFVAAPVESTAESALLRRLLAAWRTTRDPALEPAIARLGRMLAIMRGPLLSKQQAYYETEGIWLRRARDRDPADLDVLLDVPLPRFGDAHARLYQLAKRDPDPRLARLLDLALAYRNEGAKLFDRIANTLASHIASPALRDRLDAIERLGPRHAAAIAELREAIPTARPADPALLAEAEVATRVRAELEALHVQAARHPEDLGLRAVLADALQSAGDPRGEFIALQLAIANGATDPRLQRRAALLLDAHFAIWTAELPGLVRDRSRFESGFLVAAQFEGTPQGLELSAGRPIWGTVEELEFAQRDIRLGPIAHGAPHLHTITSGHNEPLHLLEATGPHPAVRAVGCLYSSWLPDQRDRLPDLAVVGGMWSGANALAEFRAAIPRARAFGLDALVWFDNVDFSSYDGTLELRFTLTRRRGGAFRPAGWAVRIPLAGPIQLAWSGPHDAPDFEPDLRSLLDHAARLGRGPCELYLPSPMTCPSDLEVAPGRPIDLTAANRT
jgi:uncharacterized protein (TIGR02996 family)